MKNFIMKYIILYILIVIGINSSSSSEQCDLKYGSGVIKLIKSKNLIAVKPNNPEKDIFSTLEDEGIKVNDIKQNLADFKILRLDNSGNGEEKHKKQKTDIENKIDMIRKSNSISMVSCVYHTGDEDQTPFVATGDIYIKFKSDTKDEECSKILHENKLTIQKGAGTEKELIVSFCENKKKHNINKDAIYTAKELQKNENIEIAEPDLVSILVTNVYTNPNNRLLPEQWHLENTGNHRGINIGLVSGADSGVVRAWRRINALNEPDFGSSDIIIAVIDDGFDIGHPDLPDLASCISPKDFKTHTTNPMYENGEWHGTACAGIALSRVGGDVIGVAPRVKFMPIRYNESYCTDKQVEEWFDHARTSGADIVSCSWGPKAKFYPLSTRKENAISKCATLGRNGNGSIVVFAAGNENINIHDSNGKSLNGFATHKNVIAVSASTSTDIKADYSNFGEAISICAPSGGAGGMGILTTDVRGAHGYEPGKNYNHNFSGTSSSCPIVAGVCALVLSVNPLLSSQTVKDILQSTARKIDQHNLNYPYNNNHSLAYGYGCIDAEEAVLRAYNIRESLVPRETSGTSPLATFH